MTGILPLDWLHDVERIEQVASWLRASGIDEFEQSDDSGRRIRLCIGNDDGVDRAAATDQELPEGKGGRVVNAPYFGRLCLCDPHGDTFANRAGDQVSVGDVMALLVHGAMTLPVRASEAGVVLSVLREDGALIGYGDGLFELDEDVPSAA